LRNTYPEAAFEHLARFEKNGQQTELRDFGSR